MRNNDNLFITILLLLVFLPSTPFLLSQTTQTQQAQTNTVGNAAGTTALIVSGAALLTTIGLSQQAIGATENAQQLIRRPLQTQTIYAVKNTTTQAKGLQIVLSNQLSQPVDVSQLSITITTNKRDHKVLYADTCTNATKEIACILPPRQNNQPILQSGERIELYIETQIPRNTDVTVDIRTPRTETTINTQTPNVFTKYYTKIR